MHLKKVKLACPKREKLTHIKSRGDQTMTNFKTVIDCSSGGPIFYEHKETGGY